MCIRDRVSTQSTWGMYCILFATLLFQVMATEPAINKQLYDKLLGMKLTWEVVPYDQSIFKNWTMTQLKRMCRERKIDVTPQDAPPRSCSPMPDNFDGREKFKQCIHPPLDQGSCGSCWAFSIAEFLSDKLCIAGKDVILSPQYLSSCDVANYGCNGGVIYYAMLYAEKYGLAEEACLPYGAGAGPTPLCPRKCIYGGEMKKYYCARGSTKILTSIEDMKCSLLNGPLSGRFDVYEDFINYKSGIYSHSGGNIVGGHAIKVVGYGVENGTNYWICENSWGRTWGLEGFFKIKHGECDIDKYMLDCTPVAQSVLPFH
eukprot:TRINITY_DN2343_c0_g1_i2.p1 TRINITY_DN2343_c0_g1~~TRINITY_DN2343_c0_g1_i2.p1  ORF type:complete len:316 (+),score=35.28 TRINITY_DN2343_c0_g1_i2:64-1011(+)